MDETGKSAWGWRQNSMIIVDRPTKKITYTDEFYLFKHLSHFVQPGSRVLKSSEGKNHVAFELTDSRIMLLLNNPEEKTKSSNIMIGETPVSVKLQPTSINSIIINI